MQARIFDIDGTLLQSVAVDDDLYRAALLSVLGPVTLRDSFHEYEHISDSGILRQVLIDNQVPDATERTAEVISHFVQSLQEHIDKNGPFDEISGAREYFEGLCNSRKHYVALATGGWEASARLKLQSAGFDLNGVTLATSDTEHDRTRIMLAALDRPESEFESITYYGDGHWDREACQKLGWGFVAVGASLEGLRSYGDIAIRGD